jgi:hypothetical protein
VTWREFVEFHPGAPWAGLVALVALVIIVQSVAGPPGLAPAETLPPAQYVVAPVVVEATAVPPASPSPSARPSTGASAGDVGPVASTTPFVDDPTAAPIRETHGSTAAGSSTSLSSSSEGER